LADNSVCAVLTVGGIHLTQGPSQKEADAKWPLSTLDARVIDSPPVLIQSPLACVWRCPAGYSVEDDGATSGGHSLDTPSKTFTVFSSRDSPSCTAIVCGRPGSYPVQSETPAYAPSLRKM